MEFTQRRPVQAARLLGAAQGLRTAINAPIPPVERPRYDRLIAAMRAELDAAIFDAAWQEGSQLSVEQLVTAASSSAEAPDVYHSSVLGI